MISPRENGGDLNITVDDHKAPHRRRDSSPIGQFILDHSWRSLRAVKSRATFLTQNDTISSSITAKTNDCQPNNVILSHSISSGSAGVRLLPQSSISDKALTSPTNLMFKNIAIFDNVSYLGCSRIEDPISESEMLQIISNFNEEKSHDSVSVCLHIPPNFTGTVRLFECSSEAPGIEISSFPIHRIRFCSRGKPLSPEDDCFALSFTQQFSSSNTNSNNENNFPLHQCHVFRCKDSETAGRALMCFANAFKNNETIQSGNGKIDLQYHSTPGIEENFEFEMFLEIKEEDFKKKGFIICPVEKNYFKMRRDREKRVVIVLRQVQGPRQIWVKKCFGVLLAPGRNLRHSDMHLLDIESLSEGQNKVFIVEAIWNPSAQNFEVLNTETPKETRVFMTIAIDAILSGLNEPVRFNLECKARIFQQFERFWYVPRKTINERYFLTIKMNETNQASISKSNSKDDLSKSPFSEQKSSTVLLDSFNVVRFESLTERERNKLKAVGDRSPTKMPTQLIHPADDDDSDSDEPLLSGSGEVNRECSDDILLIWREVISKWKKEPEKRPDELNSIIVSDGIPDVLRGEVWQLLAKVHVDTSDLVQTYRMLLEKDCPSEQVIVRDIHRTFPAHDYFKESNGNGQESLFKISKAYSLYDEEVSYCQGLSFLAAALLLHMTEEQAFCVLIKIMFDYGLRDLFKLGFDTLHLRFYQLQRLIEDYENELYTHFYRVGLETHMYASQWFLTLFTAKFPLQMVFFIVDLFLTEGVNTIFHISLALLQDSKKDLLQLDFEGILKYFRVALPRRYRTEINAKELIRSAVKLKISHKRLGKYEKEYISLKQREFESIDPVERLERENSRLKETILRLERENDDLAHELVISKIELRKKLDITEDQLETAVAVVERKSRAYDELLEESQNLREETDMVKRMCRQEVSRLDEEVTRTHNVIEQYKKICTDLGNTFDSDRAEFEEQKRSVVARIFGCERCSEAIKEWILESPHNRQNKFNNNQDTELNNTDSELKNNESSSGPTSSSKSIINRAGSSAFHIIDLMDKLEKREDHIRQVELELAQTKLALVEAQCQNQDLAHQMTTNINATLNTTSEFDSKPAWIRKTILSIKEVGTSLKQPSFSSNNNSNNFTTPYTIGNNNRVVGSAPSPVDSHHSGSTSISDYTK